MPSFYNSELNGSSQQVSLTGDEYHHLVHVLRHKPGDDITINSGKGWIGKGKINSISKTQALIDIYDTEYTEQPDRYAIAFSLLRNKNDEWLVEKVTELGVTELFPLTTQYSVRNPSANTLVRFRTTSLNAIKQCNNPWLPALKQILPLQKSLNSIIDCGYVPILASENRPDVWLDSLEKGKPYCFIIGPEGGFSPEEFEFLSKSGVPQISISRLVLRAETAAIALAAQISLINK